MNNEPVALVTEYGIQPLYEGALQEGQFLYTHPSKHDLGIAEAIGFDKGYQAGLRKAQEK